MYIKHVLLIHPSDNGLLVLFPILVIVNSAAMNTGVQISFFDANFNSFVYIFRNGIT